MFIFSSSKIQIEKVWAQSTRWIRLATFACFALLAIGTLVALCTKSPYEKIEFSQQLSTSSIRPSLGKIGQGPLALQGFVKKTSLPDLTQEMVLLAKNPHPEIQGKKGDFLLYLKSSRSEYKAKNGEQIFLSCDSLPGGLAPVYRFSDHKTPLWIKPEFSDQTGILLEVGLFTRSKEDGVFQEEKTRIMLQPDPKARRREETHSYIEILEKAKLWGQDVVLARFGADKYKSLKDKVKLEVFQQGKRVFCFLGKGDLLRFDQGEWIPIDKAEDEEECPVAQVKKVAPKSIELEVWDPNAFYSFPIKLEASIPAWAGGRGESLPQSIRWKTGNRVTCSFGKRKYVIKEGDRLLKTERGWRHLRRSIDIEAYLCHKIRGELFIFEALVKEQGKLMMKGFLIDEMRTQAWPFSSAVTLDNHVTKASSQVEKKQAFLKKSEADSTTYLFPTNKKMNEAGYE
ncbi:MAG: hypothetical protein V4489_09295 [Chlamydiota bacterium]